MSTSFLRHASSLNGFEYVCQAFVDEDVFCTINLELPTLNRTPRSC